MHWTDQLSEYLDGELAPADRAACESHLAACEPCRQVLRELQQVCAAARADADRPVAADLWPGVLARLGTGSTTWHRRAGRRVAPQRRISFSIPQLALAASLLIAVSAAVAYVAANRDRGGDGLLPATPIQAMAEPMLGPSADIVPANFADESFDRAVADLEQVLVAERHRLDPRTVMVIERNLAVIDEAIREARTALDSDPANTFLNSHLADARRRKLDLLRRAADLASAGN